MKNLEAAQRRVLLYDGSKGSLLQGMGLPSGEASELWNAEKPAQVREVYQAYRSAGAEVLQANTFPGNRVTLSGHGLGERVVELNREGTRLAREVAGRDLVVTASIGPTGRMFQPAGDLTFEQAYRVFAEQAKAIQDGGADYIHLETFTDLGEMRAAILAVRENTSLAILATTTHESGGRTLSGNSPESCAVVGQALGVEMSGANCSTGPEEMVPVLAAMSKVAWRPLLAKPNAGLPEVVGGQIVYRETPERFASFAGAFVDAGVRLLGGCCGTTPDTIRALGAELQSRRERRHEPWAGGVDSGLLASPQAVLAYSPENSRLGRIDLIDGPLAGAFREGKTHEVVEACADAAQDALLVKLDQASPDWDWWGFISSLSLYVRCPLVWEAFDSGALQNALRYYPGRCGVTGDADAQIVARYGAVSLDLKEP